ncbi:MAG: HNH endonuclease [Treponemataceae bacterium]|nr:HNH endonuclease [Treponemataceae bacterium]
MNKCYLCGKEITEENKTVEHILLNSIGGRLKSSTLICKDCNSTFGNTFDSSLSKQLEFFANFLDIKRERGVVQEVEMAKESTGEKYKVTSKGIPIPSKPIVEEIITDSKTEIRIKARSKKELVGILAGFKKNILI